MATGMLVRDAFPDLSLAIRWRALTEQDEGSALAPGQPDTGEPPAEGRADETPAPGVTDAGALCGLAARFGKVEEQLAEFHQRSAHRESVIDRLHEENQRLRGGIGRIVLEPVVADLIRLYDQLHQEVRRIESDGEDSRLLSSFAEDVAQILDRCGIEVFGAEPGDPFDRDQHRPLTVVPCDDESRHNTVADVVADGFVERETGRIRRPVQARFHQYAPNRDDAGQAHSAAQP
jgi:molecular chaperone GrpE (heat shock protein)